MEFCESTPPPLRSNFDPIWRLPGLRTEPSWWDYAHRHFDGDAAGGGRNYILRVTQIGRFALYLPPDFELFAGQQAWMGITQYSTLPPSAADRLALALAQGGIRVPGRSWRFRAVGRAGCVFFVVEPAAGDEPTLPVDWLATWEVEGVERRQPWWVGERRRASQQYSTSSQIKADSSLEQIDGSLYERRAYGWKLRDSPPLPEVFSGSIQ